MKDIKNYIIAILVILCIGLIKDGCDRRSPNCHDYPVYRVDTLTTIDTVWAKDTVIQTVWSKPKPADSTFVPYPILVTAQDSDSLCEVLMNLFQYVRFYSDTAENDDIVIIVQDSARGLITWKAVSYALKVPKYIKETNNIVVQKKWSVHGGIVTHGNKGYFGAGPFLGIRRNDVHFGMSYDLLNKVGTVSVSVELTKRRNKRSRVFL